MKYRIDFWEGKTKIIYRVYFSMYFIFCVDETESELATMDLIQSIIIIFL